MPRLFGSEESRAGEMKFLRFELWRIEAYAAYASVLVLVAYLVVSIVYPFLGYTLSVPYDAHVYDKLALDVAHGQGYNSTFRAPLYPAVLAVIYLVFGHNHSAVCVIQALMNVLTLALLMLTSYRIFRTRIVGLLASCYYVVYKPFYDFSTFTMTECTAALLAAVMVFAVIMAFERRTVGSFLVVGLAAGLLSLCKVVALLYPLAIIPVLIVTRHKDEKWMLRALAMVAAMVVVVLPWTVRNYKATGHLVVVTTGAGMNFWLGNWEPYYGKQQISRNDFPIEFAKKLTGRSNVKPGEVYWHEGKTIGGKSEAELDPLFFREGLKNLRQNPLAGVRMAARKFTVMWSGIGQGRNYTPEGKRIPRDIGESQFLAFFLILTGVASLAFRIPGWRQKVLPVVLLLVYWTAVYMAIVAVRRYSHPVMPYLMMLSAYTVYRLVGGGRLIDRVAGETH